MRYLIYLFFVFLTFFASANASAQRSRKQMKEKAAIDTLLTQDMPPLQIKLRDKVDLVPYQGNELPVDAEATVSVLRDETGNILYVGYFPIEQENVIASGYRYYFDNYGRLYAYEQVVTHLAATCADEEAIETKVRYFNKRFKLLDDYYTLTNFQGEPLDAATCGTNGRYDAEVLGTVEDLLLVHAVNFGQELPKHEQ